MQHRPRKRLRVDTASDALNRDNDIGANVQRPEPKQRISHACDRCRSRRAKCDGNQPTCVTCAAAHVTCTYGTHTKKRGLPTGYVHLLELLWTLVFDSIPGAEDATLQLLRSASVVTSDAGVALLANTNGPMQFPEDLLTQDRWARSRLREAIEARVLKIDAAVGGGSGTESRHRVVWEGITLETKQRSDSWTALLSNRKKDQSTFCADRSTVANGSPASAQVELPGDVWAQVGSYLNYNYCWLPVLRKHDIVRLLSKYQDESSCTASEMALLWSSLAVSASLKTEPDQSLVAAYHSAAMKELSNDKEQSSAYHMAAMLLLGFSKMELYQWKDAYLLIGRAARLVHYMYNTTSQHDPMLNRIYLGAFILDTLLSSYLNTPAFLSAQHIMPALSVYEADGPEEWDSGPWDLSGAGTAGQIQCPVRTMSIFGQLARLMVVLNAATAPGDQRVSAADKLSEWLDQLPKHCSPERRSGPLTPPLANLDMMHWAVRPCIFGSTPSKAHVSTSPVADYTRIFDTHGSKSLLQICQKFSQASTQGSQHERDTRTADIVRNGTSADTAILRDFSLPFTQQIPPRVTETQYRIDEDLICIPDSLHDQSLIGSHHSPTSFVLGNDLEHTHLNLDDTLGRDLDDTGTMQTMLENILAQDAGNEPFLSNFMQDLGFFDEDLLPQDCSL